MAKKQKGTMFPRPNRGQVSNKKLRWVSIVAGFFAVSAVIAGTGAVVWYVTTGRTTTADPNAGLTVSGPTNLNAGLTVSNGTTTLSSLAASGEANLNAGLTVSGGTTTLTALAASGAANLNAGLTVSGGITTLEALTASGATTLSSTLEVTDTATFINTLTANGNVNLGNSPNTSVTINSVTTARSAFNVGVAAVGSTPAIAPEFRVFGNTFLNTLGVSGNVTLGIFPAAVPGGASASTVTLNAELTANGAINLGNEAADAITVDGTSTFSAPATFGSTLTANGNVTLGTSPVSVPGGASANTVTLNAILIANGATSLLGNTNIGSSSATLVTDNPTLNVYGVTNIGSLQLNPELNTYGPVTIGSSVLDAMGNATLDTDTLTVNSPSTFNNTLIVNNRLTVNSLLTVDNKGRLRGVPVNWTSRYVASSLAVARLAQTINWSIAFVENNTNVQPTTIPVSEVEKVTINFTGILDRNNANQSTYEGSIAFRPVDKTSGVVSTTVYSEGNRYIVIIPISINFPSVTTAILGSPGAAGGSNIGAIQIGAATIIDLQTGVAPLAAAAVTAGVSSFLTTWTIVRT